MEDGKAQFVVVANDDHTFKGYNVATVAQAKENIETVSQAFISSSAFQSSEPLVRLKNGFFDGEDKSSLSTDDISMDYSPFRRFEWKLLTNSMSGKELPKEEYLLALAYAAHNDDVEVVEELVQFAGPGILKTRMPCAYLQTILHICTHCNSLKTLEKVLTGYPESVDVCLTDRDGDTALHNPPNNSISQKDSYQAACLLLSIPRGVDAANSLMGILNNYLHNRRMTALCKALICEMPHVGAALLEAAKTIEEKQSEEIRPPHWLTVSASGAAWSCDDYDDDASNYTALHLAVHLRYGEIVRKILAHPGAKALNLTSLRDNKDNTPLHVAAKVKDSAICSMLLEHMGAETSSKDSNGGGVNTVNKAGETPLHIAATQGHAETCERLLEYGASLSVQDAHGKFALTNAFAMNHRTVLEVLLDACLKASKARSASDSQIHTKAHEGSLIINNRFEFGFTPLHVATAVNALDHIRQLLEGGARVDCTSDDERTPLHVSAQQLYDVDDDGAAFKLLLNEAKKERNYSKSDRGKADWINMRDTWGQTALHILVGRLFSKLVGKESSESSEKGSKGELPSTYDKMSSDIETYEPDINNEARIKLCTGLVSLLLAEEGARVDVEDSNGETPLHVAARHAQLYEVLHTLLCQTEHPKNFRRGNDLDKWICMCDFAGETALHEAARAGSEHSVRILLEKAKSRDVLLRVRDVENMTAIDWAARNRTQTQAKPMIDEIMNTKYSINEVTKGFLMWSLKDRVQFDVFKSYCKDYETKGISKDLLQAAIENEDVNLAREIVNRGIDVTILDNDAQISWLAQNLGKASSDQPTLKDSLDRRKLVKGVATLLVNPYTETPINIGVFGSWGAGKSSFMLQVEETMLSMVVEQTFKDTTYSASLDEAQPTTKLSTRGHRQCSMVESALDKHYMVKPNKPKKYPKRPIGAIIKDLSMQARSTCRPLLRSLALTDRSKLVQSHTQAWYKRKVPNNAHFTAYTPAMLTLTYNAWQYDNKNEASAGLAVEISKQLESLMTPQQWLRMCWKYSWKSRPKEIIVHLIVPILLAIVATFIALVLWKFVPIETRYKVLSLPVGIAGVVGALFKTFLNAIQPVTWTMMNLTKSFDHKSMLGYQHQVIGDIRFLKDQLCNDAHFGWIITSIFCRPFISNTYFVEGTWIWRQCPSLNNFRIVVFVDDLDRCDEKTVLELLRATSLILGSCGISVVIGVDMDMLRRAIVKEFLKDSSDNYFDMWLDDKVSYKEKNPQNLDNVDEKTASDKKHLEKMAGNRKKFEHDRYSLACEFADKYMQKIIQLPIHMPDPSEERLKIFLENQVGQSFIKVKKDNQKTKTRSSETERLVAIEIDKKSIEDKETFESQHNSQEGPSEASETHLLLANYTPIEKNMLQHLCQFTIEERRTPREWKRFLSYHRLAWTILSQDSSMKHKEFKGWQRKLILWIFICWNWRPQMDDIFQNWHEITSQNSKWQAQLHSKSATVTDTRNVELLDIIKTYRSMKSNTMEETNKNMGKQGEKRASLVWNRLQSVLKKHFDIQMHFVEKFQQFRFFCVLNHLHIGEEFQPKRKK